MEFLPEDPKKRTLTLVVLGVIVLAGGIYAYIMFFGGESAPKSVEQAMQEGSTAPTPAPDAPGTRSRGGARTATQGN